MLVLIDCLDGRFLLIKLKNEDENHLRLRFRNEPDGKLYYQNWSNRIISMIVIFSYVFLISSIVIISNKSYLGPCQDYGGIPHPSKPLVCCDANCGKYCGADDCNDGPGGEQACCASKISTPCREDRRAPCVRCN